MIDGVEEKTMQRVGYTCEYIFSISNVFFISVDSVFYS